MVDCALPLCRRCPSGTERHRADSLAVESGEVVGAATKGFMMALTKGQKRIFLVVAVVAALFWMKSRQKGNSDDTVAWVNRRPVSRSYFEQFLGSFPSGGDVEETKRLAMEKVVERRALLGLAVERGLLNSPVLQEQVEDMLVAELRRLELEPLAAWTPGEEEILAEYERVKETMFLKPEAEPLEYLPLEQVRENVVSRLVQAKHDAAFSAMTSNAVAAASVKVNEELMSTIGTTPTPGEKGQP